MRIFGILKADTEFVKVREQVKNLKQQHYGTYYLLGIKNNGLLSPLNQLIEYK